MRGAIRLKHQAAFCPLECFAFPFFRASHRLRSEVSNQPVLFSLCLLLKQPTLIAEVSETAEERGHSEKPDSRPLASSRALRPMAAATPEESAAAI